MEKGRLRTNVKLSGFNDSRSNYNKPPQLRIEASNSHCKATVGFPYSFVD